MMLPETLTDWLLIWILVCNIVMLTFVARLRKWTLAVNDVYDRLVMEGLLDGALENREIEAKLKDVARLFHRDDHIGKAHASSRPDLQ
jgi:hypothetical protein